MSIGKAYYVSWWHIADRFPYMMKQCEIIAKIVCRTSDLKSDDYNLKHSTFFFEKSGNLREWAAYEDIDHIIMSCSSTYEMRR